MMFAGTSRKRPRLSPEKSEGEVQRALFAARDASWRTLRPGSASDKRKQPVCDHRKLQSMWLRKMTRIKSRRRRAREQPSVSGSDADETATRRTGCNRFRRVIRELATVGGRHSGRSRAAAYTGCWPDELNDWRCCGIPRWGWRSTAQAAPEMCSPLELVQTNIVCAGAA